MLDEMTLMQAIRYNAVTGKSFTCTRWSKTAQEEIQFYVFQGELYCQEGADRIEQVKSISCQKMSDKYKFYEGQFPQFHKELISLQKRFKQLRTEVEPLYSQFKEYEELKEKLEQAGLL